MVEKYPIPPGAPGHDDAKQTDVEIKPTEPAAASAPQEVAKPGVFRRRWSFMKQTTRRVGSFCGTVLGRAAGGVGYCLHSVNHYLLSPVIGTVERWVPCAGKLRSAAGIWCVVVLIMGMCIGFLVAAEAGLGVMATLAMGAFGIVLVPYVVFSTPALWPAIALDLWIMSTILVVFDAIGDWSESRGFWKPLLFSLWPGMVESLSPVGTVHPTTGEILNVPLPQPTTA